MKSKIFQFAIIAIIAFSNFSCSSDDVPAPIVAPTTTALFRYSENAPLNLSTNILTAPTATFSTQFNTLMVKNAANVLLFEINLTAAIPATYAVNANNVISYTAVNPFFVPTSGNVIITANANGKISGTFEGLGLTNPSGVSRIYGEFNSVNIIL